MIEIHKRLNIIEEITKHAGAPEMSKLLKSFLRDKSGETYIEYIMLGAMLSVIAVSLFTR